MACHVTGRCVCVWEYSDGKESDKARDPREGKSFGASRDMT